MPRTYTIGLIGDYNPDVVAHQAIPGALGFASEQLGVQLQPVWLPTIAIDPASVATQLAGYDALWCVPNSPYQRTSGALAAIRYARESGTPFLGTCGGFQHALLEYAQHALGLHAAAHAETDPEAAFALIAPLACSLVEQRGTIMFAAGSRLRAIYGSSQAEEGYHCRYGLNPQYEHLLADTPLLLSGRDTQGEVRAIELGGHPFFMAVLFQPERSALRGVAHPLICAFGQAVLAQ